MSHNYDTGFLLAYDEVRVRAVHEKISYLPKIWQYYSCLSHDAPPHVKSMTFIEVGN